MMDDVERSRILGPFKADIEKKEKEIADLKAQLAEKDGQLGAWKRSYDALDAIVVEKDKRIEGFEKAIISIGCGGHRIGNPTDGYDFDCEHEYEWDCDNCPIVVREQDYERDEKGYVVLTKANTRKAMKAFEDKGKGE